MGRDQPYPLPGYRVPVENQAWYKAAASRGIPDWISMIGWNARQLSRQDAGGVWWQGFGQRQKWAGCGSW